MCTGFIDVLTHICWMERHIDYAFRFRGRHISKNCQGRGDLGPVNQTEKAQTLNFNALGERRLYGQWVILKLSVMDFGCDRGVK